MGGLAFSSGDNPLYTPRMPPAVYEYVLDFCSAKLRELFVVVATPIPGPAKKDYGDIDLFVAWERNAIFPSPSSTSLVESLSPSDDLLGAAERLLEAERAISTPGGKTLAIPWPTHLCEEATSNPDEDGSDTKKPRFIQVDLHYFATLKQLQWLLFKHAHSDFWSIVGATIRPFGLTIDEGALHIRIPEIEALDKKKSKVVLTQDPVAILDFLGFKQDQSQWEKPFESAEEFFTYAASCRLFWVRPLSDEDNEGNAEGKAEGSKIDKAKLKANDRRRMNQRPLCREWYEEFIPKCRREGLYAPHNDLAENAIRDSVRLEAFERFPGTQHAYEARILEWRKERQRQGMKGLIKAAMPEIEEPDEVGRSSAVHWRSNTASALKKIILDEDYSLGIQPEMPLKDDENGLYDEDKIKEFVVDQWQAVGQLAWEELQRKYKEKLDAKEKEAAGMSHPS